MEGGKGGSDKGKKKKRIEDENASYINVMASCSIIAFHSLLCIQFAAKIAECSSKL